MYKSTIGDIVGSVFKEMVELVIMETLWSIVTAMVRVNIKNAIWLIAWVIVVLAGNEMIGSIVELMAGSPLEGIV